MLKCHTEPYKKNCELQATQRFISRVCETAIYIGLSKRNAEFWPTNQSEPIETKLAGFAISLSSRDTKSFIHIAQTWSRFGRWQSWGFGVIFLLTFQVSSGPHRALDIHTLFTNWRDLTQERAFWGLTPGVCAGVQFSSSNVFSNTSALD